MLSTLASFVGPPSNSGELALTSRSLAAVDYALAPESPFPAAIHDAVASYKYLVDDLKIPPPSITVGGDSAGGNLAMALILYLRDHDMPQVGSALLISPWVDLTASLGSWDSNAVSSVALGSDLTS